MQALKDFFLYVICPGFALFVMWASIWLVFFLGNLFGL